MSGWKVVTTWLYEAGRGPLPAKKFDRYEMPLSSFRSAIAEAIKHGVMRNTAGTTGRGRSLTGLFELTPLGIDWKQGRVQIAYLSVGYRAGSVGRVKGSNMRVSATWLKALPRPGEIRLGKP